MNRVLKYVYEKLQAKYINGESAYYASTLEYMRRDLERLEEEHENFYTNPRLKRLEGKYTQVITKLHMIDQKFEVLCNLLGVSIVAAYLGQDPQPYVNSIRENGLLGDAQEYLKHVVIAEELIKLHHRMLSDQKELMKGISLRGG